MARRYFFGREFRFPIRKSSARDGACKTSDMPIVVTAERTCCDAAKMWRPEVFMFLREQPFFTID
jgi:hypothetical protein